MSRYEDFLVSWSARSLLGGTAQHPREENVMAIEMVEEGGADGGEWRRSGDEESSRGSEDVAFCVGDSEKSCSASAADDDGDDVELNESELMADRGGGSSLRALRQFLARQSPETSSLMGSSSLMPPPRPTDDNTGKKPAQLHF